MGKGFFLWFLGLPAAKLKTRSEELEEGVWKLFSWTLLEVW